MNTSETNTPAPDAAAVHTSHNTLVGIGLVVGIALLTLVLLRTTSSTAPIGCTMDALVCPDGSAVGRQGPSCSFSPCPQADSLTGVLIGDENGLGLLVSSTEQTDLRVPLVFRVSNTVGDFEGREVVVRGNFTEGSTYAVDSLALALSAGEGDAARDVQFVGVGEAASLDTFSVTLNSVVQDNRCPIDVQCIEGGAITANVTYRAGDEEKTFTMPSDEVPQEFTGYRISIAEVVPEAVSTQSIAESEYRVGFRIERIEGDEAEETPPEEVLPLLPNP